VTRSRDELVVLGVITRPHGLRGEVRVHRYNPESTRLAEVGRVVVRKDGADREFTVRGHKRSGGADVLWLEGIDGVDQAEALRGAEVGVLRKDLPPLPEGEYYHVDLVGLRVHEGGVELGEVVGVTVLPTVDVLRVRTARGVLGIPILAPYVVSIAIDRGIIEVAYSEDFDPEPPEDA